MKKILSICCFSGFLAYSWVVFGADKVVVVPLGGSAGNGTVTTRNFVNAETTHVWNCPPSPMSLAVVAPCPDDCVAVGGGCSAKTVGDATDVIVTGANFAKTEQQLLQYNAYECYMMAGGCSNPGNPPTGYAQVVCFCNTAPR